jgi:hypothetical protein
MKNKGQDTILLNQNLTNNKNSSIDKNKTTNINILLNRVKMDKKRDLKKKIFFSTLLVSTVTIVAIFAII